MKASPAPSVAHLISQSRERSTQDIKHRRFVFHAENQTVTLDDFKIDPNQVDLRVVDTSHLPLAKNAYRLYSLTEVRDALNPLLVVDAGTAATLSVPTSLGLVLTNGHVATSISHSLFATGVFCVNSSGAAKVAYISEFSSLECRDAVQSGPVIVSPGGHLGIHTAELSKPPLRRSLVSIDSRGSAHFIITSPAHLYDVAAFIIHFLGSNAALNLATGTTQSGLLVDDGHITLVYGNVNASIPAAIAVFRKNQLPR
ncbi:MAG: hypothetical protein JO233_02960 [Candidatus Eremiobacteraeota bacterium]|nr:hypothetical protein [Candidatus Eremiobacteraeota bacterium]